MDLKTTMDHSKMAFDKWKPLWFNNCARNKGKITTSQKQILNAYKDKTACLFAFGPSFEKNVKDLKESKLYKEFRDTIVIGCVDKAFKPLIERGIKVDFVMIADGTISIEYLDGVPDEVIKDTILISNAYGQPDWSDRWARVAGKSRIFWYMNKDNLENRPLGTAEIFGPACDYYEVIEAASNVGNTLVVYSSKIFGCKEICLFAYDYSWNQKAYYGVDDKKSAIKKATIGVMRKPNQKGEIVQTSTNMDFSASWLDKWIIYQQHNWGVETFDFTRSTILKEGRKMVCQS